MNSQTTPVFFDLAQLCMHLKDNIFERTDWGELEFHKQGNSTYLFNQEYYFGSISTHYENNKYTVSERLSITVNSEQERFLTYLNHKSLLFDGTHEFKIIFSKKGGKVRFLQSNVQNCSLPEEILLTKNALHLYKFHKEKG